MAPTTTNKVVDLTNDIYEQFLNGSEIAVVAFYLPWLPNYQRFSREFVKATALINDPRIRYGQVDSTKQDDLFQKYKAVPAWPAINLFKSSAEIVSLNRVYMGNLTARAISSWVTRQTSPSITVLDFDSLESFRKASEVVVIGYMAQDDHDSYQTFSAVAKTLQNDYLFGIVHDVVLAAQEQVKIPGIALYKDFDEGKNVLDEVEDKDSITQFVKRSATPLVVEFLPETIRSIKNWQIPLGYLFANDSELADIRKDVAQPLAMKYKGKIQLGTADIKINSGLAEQAHANIDGMPSFAIADTVKHRHYPLKDTILTADTVDAFIQSFLDSELTPEIKSAPIPRSQGPVMEVVADSWNELVINNDKDVFIEYYTPWCGPCKALLPDLTKLAETYAANSASRDKVIIAKIDADANDLDSDVRGFPTFKLFPAGSKDSPVVFMKECTIQEWAKFIQEHGGNDVKLGLTES